MPDMIHTATATGTGTATGWHPYTGVQMRASSSPGPGLLLITAFLIFVPSCHLAYNATFNTQNVYTQVRQIADTTKASRGWTGQAT